MRKYDYILIDGYGVFLRYFFSTKYNFLKHRYENKNHTLFLALRRIFSLYKNYNPHYIIWVFEKGSKVHKAYDKNYKSGRAKMYQVYEPIRKEFGFTEQLNRLKEYIKNLHFTLDFTLQGDEADTVIAEFIRVFNTYNNNLSLLVVSYDNDFWQLLAYPNVHLLIKSNLITQNNYSRYIKTFKYVPPISYPLYKAIKGDKTDNIKGIHGIGDKTLERIFFAAWSEKRILRSYDDLINFLQSSKLLPSPLINKLLQNADIIKHNLPLVDLLNIELLSLSGRVIIKQFVESLLNNKIIKYKNNDLIKKMLTEDNLTYYSNILL